MALANLRWKIWVGSLTIELGYPRTSHDATEKRRKKGYDMKIGGVFDYTKVNFNVDLA